MHLFFHCLFEDALSLDTQAVSRGEVLGKKRMAMTNSRVQLSSGPGNFLACEMGSHLTVFLVYFTSNNLIKCGLINTSLYRIWSLRAVT